MVEAANSIQRSDDGDPGSRLRDVPCQERPLLNFLKPFFDRLIEPVICTDPDFRIVYGNPVFVAAWQLPDDGLAPTESADDASATYELVDHADRATTVTFDLVTIFDTDGRPRRRVGLPTTSDADVIDDLRHAAALISARVNALGGGVQGLWDPDLDGDMERLSTREREVVELILQGNRVATVASLLFVSEHTVRNHLKRVYQKFDVHSLGELREYMAPRAVYRAS